MLSQSVGRARATVGIDARRRAFRRYQTVLSDIGGQGYFFIVHGTRRDLPGRFLLAGICIVVDAVLGQRLGRDAERCCGRRGRQEQT
jgi:hypothetical protein